MVRHQNTKEEEDILQKYFPIYMSYERYSAQRKELMKEVFKLLHECNRDYWTERTVRQWFTSKDYREKGTTPTKATVNLIGKKPLEGNLNPQVEVKQKRVIINLPKKEEFPIKLEKEEKIDQKNDQKQTFKIPIIYLQGIRNKEDNLVKKEPKKNEIKSKNVEFEKVDKVEEKLEEIEEKVEESEEEKDKSEEEEEKVENEEEKIEEEEEKVEEKKNKKPKFSVYNIDDFQEKKSALYGEMRKLLDEANPTDSIKKQEYDEAKMNDITENLNELGYNVASRAISRTTKCIDTKESPKFMRQFSTNTYIYSKDKVPKTEEKRNEGSEASLDLKIKNLEAFAFDGTDYVYAYFDENKEATYLCYNKRIIPTGLFSPPTAIFVDHFSDFIWIAGDFRVKAFSIKAINEHKEGKAKIGESDTLSILYPKKKYSQLTDSKLLVNEEYVFLSVKNEILIWNKNTNDNASPKKESPLNTKERKTIAENNDYDLDRCSWNRGRSRSKAITINFSDSKGEITSIALLDDNKLIISSNKHHTFYIYSIEEDKIVKKIVSHSSGITGISLSGDKLIVPSFDCTTIIYNVNNFEKDLVINMSGSPTICGCTVKAGERNLLFLGSMEETRMRDTAVIRVYDLKRGEMIKYFSLRKGIPSAIAYDSNECKLKIASLPKNEGKSKDIIERAVSKPRGKGYVYSVDIHPLLE